MKLQKLMNEKRTQISEMGSLIVYILERLSIAEAKGVLSTWFNFGLVSGDLVPLLSPELDPVSSAISEGVNNLGALICDQVVCFLRSNNYPRNKIKEFAIDATKTALPNTALLNTHKDIYQCRDLIDNAIKTHQDKIQRVITEVMTLPPLGEIRRLILQAYPKLGSEARRLLDEQLVFISENLQKMIDSKQKEEQVEIDVEVNLLHQEDFVLVEKNSEQIVPLSFFKPQRLACKTTEDDDAGFILVESLKSAPMDQLTQKSSTTSNKF